MIFFNILVEAKSLNINIMENKKNKMPFFASFLEKQIAEPEKIKGGSETAVTAPLKDNVTTALKDSVTKPSNDNVTMKYPSDGDEGGNEI